VEVALGPLVGFVAGALLFLADLSATAAVTTILASSVTSLTAFGESVVLRGFIIVLILAGLALGNVRGVKTGSRMIEVVTVCKLLPLVGFVVAGAFFVEPEKIAWNGTPGVSETLKAAGFLIFAFSGIEGALVPSGEVRAPSRTVPRAIFLALGLATLLYLAIQIVAQGVMGPDLVEDKVTPLASTASRFAGPVGGKLMIAAAAISMFGYLSGAVLAAPRCLFAFGRDGFLPRTLASVHPRFRTPYVAIAVYVSLVALLALTGRFETLAVLANVTILSLDLLCAVSVWILRKRDVRMAGEPFRIPGGPIVPALATASVVWLLWETVTRREIAAVGLVLVLAIAAYVIRALRLRAVSPPA
jgi:amino acid transporter